MVIVTMLSSLPLEILIMVFDKVNHKDLIQYSKYFEFARISLDKKLKSPFSLRIASQGGSVYALSKLLEKYKFYYELYYLADDAAENGYLSTLKWLTDKNVIPTQSVRNLTAYNGHLHVLVWLDKNFPVKYQRQYNTAMYFAIQANQLNIVKYFVSKLDKSFRLYRRILREACENGKLDIIKWVLSQEDTSKLKNHVYDDTPTAIDLAVPNGHIDVIEYLYSKGFKPSFFAAIYAAQNNHLEILKWLNTNTDPNILKSREADYSLIDACKLGNKECVVWMIDTHIYPQDVLDLSVDNAMNNCHFEIVKFLKENTSATNTRWFPIKHQ